MEPPANWGRFTLGHARRFRAEIVNYADDFCVLGKAPAAEMLTAVERLVAGLKLTVNERKTRCLRCPEEPLEFLGYRIGRNYRPYGKGAYIGTRPGKASVQSICRRISDMTARGWSWQSPEAMVESLNRTMTGWANYFSLGHQRIGLDVGLVPEAGVRIGQVEPPPVCRRLQSKYGWSLWKKVTEQTGFQQKCAPALFG